MDTLTKKFRLCIMVLLGNFDYFCMLKLVAFWLLFQILYHLRIIYR